MKLIHHFLLFFFSIITINSFSQFTTTQNNIADSLAHRLAGSGVTITNATLNCPTAASGYFNNAPVALGVTDGVILSSGNVIDVPGATAGIVTGNHMAPGDAGLNAIFAAIPLPYTTNDACALEFDITVTGDSLKFNYVFGSEEYTSFVCNGFNDLFAFFISGPNPAGGFYVNENVAIVPGSSPPEAVAINTVNDGTPNGTDPGCNAGNTTFYNGAVAGVIFEGNTVRLEALAATVPCQTYHFKLVIADGGDNAYDSGVFLEEGSFSSNAVVIGSSSVLGAGFTDGVEGCVDALFTLTTDTALAFDYYIPFVISGTATNGVDYTFIADSVLMLANDTVTSVYIDVLNDTLTEGTEIITLTPYTICGTLGTPSSLNIVDEYLRTITLNDTLCSSSVISLTATGSQFYNWQDSTLFADNNIASVSTINPITQTTSFFMYGTLGDCSYIDTTTFWLSQSNPSFHLQDISCAGADDGAYWIILNDSAEIPFTYGFPLVPSTDSSVTNLPAGTQLASATDAMGCTFTDLHVFTDPVSLIFDTIVSPVSCPGASDGSICIYNIANGTYTVIVDTNGVQYDSINMTINNDTFCIEPLGVETYDVSFTNDTLDCSASFSATIIGANPLSFNYDTTNVSCNGLSDGSICVYDLLDGNYTADVVYNGINLPQVVFAINSDTFCYEFLVAGYYDILLTNTDLCNLNFSVNLTEPDTLLADITVMGTGLCAGDSIDSLVSVVSGGTTSYQYLWNTAATSANISSLAFGTYVLEVTDANGCIDSADVTIVAPTPLYLSLVQDSVLCFGDNTGLAYVDSISGGQAPYSYSWNDPLMQINDTATVSAGQYILTVTDLNSCVIIDTVNVFEQSSALSLNLVSDTISCFGGDTCIDATIFGGTIPYTYLWNDALAQTTEDVCGLIAGTYSLTVTDDNACQIIDSITINEATEITLTLDSTNVLCKDEANGTATVTATGGSGTYTYLWNDALTQTTATATNLIAGLYTVVVTDINDINCFKTINVNIEEPTDSILITLDSITNVLCNGTSTGEINISVSGGTLPYAFSWSNSSTNEDLINVTVGIYTVIVTDSNSCQMSLTDSISEPTALSLGLTTDLITCFGGDTCINATIFGGTIPYTYLWNDALAQTTEDVCGLIAGTYSLTVTDDNACQIIDSITINEATEITLTLDSTNVLCKDEANGTATVTATGGSGTYTYLWNDALTQTTATATNLITGLYTVVVTDVNDINCFKTINVNIEEPTDSLQANLNNLQNVLCFGASTGSIDVNITGGTIPYSYNWSNSAVSEDLLGLIANSYSLTVTDDNNCTAVYSDIINQPFELAIVVDSTRNINCFNGNDGEISISVSGGISPYTYSWNNGETTDDLTNLSSGSYTVTVTDSNLCTVSETIALTQAADVVISFNYSDYNGVNVSCNGSNDGTIEAVVVSGGSAPFTYSWSNGMTGNPITGISANTSINVSIIDENACSYNQDIIPLNEPNILIVSKDSLNIDCAGANNGTATANPNGGTSPYTYAWSNGQTSQTATNLAPNTYNCVVTDANACSESIVVIIEEPSQIIITTQMDSVKCWGDDDGVITILATGGSVGVYQYSIDGGLTYQNESVFTGLTAGVYNNILVSEIGNENCSSATISEVVMQPEPMFIFINPEDTTVQLEESVPLEIMVDPSTGYYSGGIYTTTDITNIVWTPTNGLNCTDCLNPTVLTYDHTNVYLATVTYSQYGCTTDATATINVENNLKFFIPSGFSPNGDGINDFFFVYGEGLRDFNIAIFNRWGEKVFETSVQAKAWDGVYKGVLQNPGIYTYGFNAIYLDNKEISLKGSITLIR